MLISNKSGCCCECKWIVCDLAKIESGNESWKNIDEEKKVKKIKTQKKNY